MWCHDFFDASAATSSQAKTSDQMNQEARFGVGHVWYGDVCMFAVHCPCGGMLLALWSCCSHATAHVDRPGPTGLHQCSCPCDARWANMGTNLPPSLSAISTALTLCPLFILSTATCEPQRRRSVQDLPGICSESSQVRPGPLRRGVLRQGGSLGLCVDVYVLDYTLLM